MFRRRRHTHHGDHPPAVSQRFEAKYIIRASDALAIREHLRPFMDPDPNGQEYPVTSIYLDSPDLNMYWSSARGEERRQKLRIRTYARGNGHACYFEVKRRYNQIVKKDRAVVHAKFADALAHGSPITPDMLLYPERDLENLYHFHDLRERLDATPRVVVRYLREAWIGKMDEPLRITFDRHITCLPSDRYDPPAWEASPYWFEAPGEPMVLEVKFTDAFPIWVEDMIRRLDLLRDSFAKYVVCVDGLQREGVGVRGRLEAYT